MKTFVIGDLHNHVNWIETFLEENEHDRVIFLGDYFDNFGDGQYDAEKTANWLARSVQHSNRIHLMGNHDMPYRFPANLRLSCPGWTPSKSRKINSIFGLLEDLGAGRIWDKIKLAHFEHEFNFIFSHAGLTEKIFRVCPVNGPNLKSYEAKIDEALELFNKHDQCHNEVAVQNADYTYDGITWIRPYNIRLIPEVTQVVGHTPTNVIQGCKMLESTPIFTSHENGGKMVNIDCAHSWVGVFEDGEFYCVRRDDTSIIMRD